MVGIPLTASASGPVDVSVTPSPVHAGQSFDVHFKVNSQFEGEALATVKIGTCSGCSDVWKSNPRPVYSGKSYDEHPPPLAHGHYIANVMVITQGVMGGAALGGFANFQVVKSAQTQTVSSTTSEATTQAQTASPATVEAPFDFAISVSPTEQTTTPGQSAAYVVTVELVSGSPKPVNLSTQNVTAGIDAHLIRNRENRHLTHY